MPRHQLKDSEVLRQTRRLIDEGYSQCICFAINATDGSSKQVNRLREYVMAQLRGHTSYDSWVRWRHPYVHKCMLRTQSAFRQGRIQWLDWMIKSLEAEGR